MPLRESRRLLGCGRVRSLPRTQLAAWWTAARVPSMSKQAYWLSRITRCAKAIAWRSVRSPAATSAASARASPRRACAAYATDAVGQPVSPPLFRSKSADLRGQWRRRESNPRPQPHRLSVYKRRLPFRFARRPGCSRPTDALADPFCVALWAISSPSAPSPFVGAASGPRAIPGRRRRARSP